MIKTQLVIIGAGVSGCATALAMRKTGLSDILIIDRPMASAFRVGESATPDVPRFLQQLGLNANLQAQGHLPHYANLSLWGGRAETIDFLRQGKGHGWQLNRAAFDEALKKSVITEEIKLLSPAYPTGIAYNNDYWQLEIEHAGKTVQVQTRAIVDAAGRRAPLATRLGAERYQIDRLLALAVQIPATADLKGQVLVEAFADGWWYATGLPTGQSLVVLMTDSDIAIEYGWRHTERFLHQWSASTELKRRLPPSSSPFSVSSFAAHSGFINRAAGAGWFVVGDALLSFDPLTSSGIAGALSDALAVTEPILSWLNGDSTATTAGITYCQRANNTLNRYLNERQTLYAKEKRWQDHPFWSRRHRA